MKQYIKQCRPYRVSSGGQGFSDDWIPLGDWTNEENEELLRKKYPDSLLQKIDSNSVLKFRYRYIEHNETDNKIQAIIDRIEHYKIGFKNLLSRGEEKEGYVIGGKSMDYFLDMLIHDIKTIKSQNN